jgi:hypothetical protein
MFPDDADVSKVQQAFFDPFEYLALRHKAGLLKTEFQAGIGKIAYHVACHQRVQRIGMKTRDVLELIPARRFDENRKAGGQPREKGGSRRLCQRLPDGGAPYLRRARRR